MSTSRISIVVPGTFAPKRSVTPSSGWMRMTRAFLPSSSMSFLLNGWCGAALNTTATSVTRRPSRLPVRR